MKTGKRSSLKTDQNKDALTTRFSTTKGESNKSFGRKLVTYGRKYRAQGKAGHAAVARSTTVVYKCIKSTRTCK